MTVRDLLTEAAARLRSAGVASPEADAELLLSHVLGVSRAALALHGPLTGAAEAEFDRLVARRRAREPLQHLTGSAPFRYREFAVGPGVFVPRPETESMVQWAIDSLAGVETPLVVDLCAGSGAIAGSLAYELPHARVHAVELDERAHAYAVRNLDGSEVDLRLGDIADSLQELDGSADLVLANPPYVPLDAYDGVEPEARDHDPALALWSGADGLDMIGVVERVAHRLLAPGGLAGCEHADCQEAAAVEIFSGSGRWLEVRDHADLASRPRFVTARKS